MSEEFRAKLYKYLMYACFCFIVIGAFCVYLLPKTVNGTTSWEGETVTLSVGEGCYIHGVAGEFIYGGTYEPFPLKGILIIHQSHHAYSLIVWKGQTVFIESNYGIVADIETITRDEMTLTFRKES